ncbi:GDSL-type esterase/lipase family protein [Frankia sp. Ag45/Mut15]|uniref:GDSL-type esterase/lipase family protein n=1 Tax=Frankia umida TaxID=573489 RepID=A0ABT0K5D4_9ACTN|nr:GDSL-type esterase/lipase family protein [Frankia umida]MCK9878995.1 GDSL-type esterase/lipase family protein [Frankia umida]
MSRQARLQLRSSAKRVALFRALPPPTGAVVFLGDSITEGCTWEGWFPELRTANRGISGDRVAQMTARLDSALHRPAVVSILAGTNDLHLGDSRQPDAIADRFRLLVAAVRDGAPEAALLVNSVLPRQQRFADRIEALNARYRRIAATAGAQYLDLWPVLAAPDRSLRRELTVDGLHLNAAGYRAWVEILRPHLLAHPSARRLARPPAPGERA